MRIDPEVRDELGVRSAVAVPIFSRKGVTGALVALSRQPNVFDTGDVLSLRALADAVGSKLAQGEPVEEPEWLREASKRQAKNRNRILFGLLGVIALLLIALVAVNIILHEQERPAPSGPAPTSAQPTPRT
jgi:GAF domain-containing protein